MQVEQVINSRIVFLRKEIEVLQSLIDRAPAGNLRVCVNGKWSRWLIYYPYDKKTGTKEHREYLKKSEKDLAKLLWEKKGWMEHLEVYSRELRILETAFKALEKLTSRKEELCSRRMNQATIRDVAALSEKIDWESEDYEKNSFHPESLTAECPDGQMMRSKSEVFIAMALSAHNIPYRYECAVELNGIKRYPDFMIRRPLDGRIIIWEHFGLWDNPEYREDAYRKLEQYTNAGYIPGDNLIFTFETKDVLFSPAKAEDVINMYLM